MNQISTIMTNFISPITVLNAVLDHAMANWPTDKIEETKQVIENTKISLSYTAPEVMWHRVRTTMIYIDSEIIRNSMTATEINHFHEKIKPIYDAYIKSVEEHV